MVMQILFSQSRRCAADQKPEDSDYEIGQIRKRSTSPYSLLWESGLLATVTLNEAHQAATKNEEWL